MDSVLAYKAEKRSLAGFPGSRPITNEALLELDCDILIPSALGGVIHKFNADRIHYWLSHGAQASPTVHNLLVDEKILTGAKKVKASKSKKATAQAVAPNTEAAKPAEAPAT